MGHSMSSDEVVSFMREGSRTGKLAVTRKDGSPHVVPVWFDFDDDTGDLMFVTGTESIKGRSMRRDGRVSICVDTMELPYAFARIDGMATLQSYDQAPEAMLHWATETCRRYVGDDQANQFGQRNTAKEESLVRVKPTKYVGESGITD